MSNSRTADADSTAVGDAAGSGNIQSSSEVNNGGVRSPAQEQTDGSSVGMSWTAMLTCGIKGEFNGTLHTFAAGPQAPEADGAAVGFDRWARVREQGEDIETAEVLRQRASRVAAKSALLGEPYIAELSAAPSDDHGTQSQPGAFPDAAAAGDEASFAAAAEVEAETAAALIPVEVPLDEHTFVIDEEDCPATSPLEVESQAEHCHDDLGPLPARTESRPASGRQTRRQSDAQPVNTVETAFLSLMRQLESTITKASEDLSAQLRGGSDDLAARAAAAAAATATALRRLHAERARATRTWLIRHRGGFDDRAIEDFISAQEAAEAARRGAVAAAFEAQCGACAAAGEALAAAAAAAFDAQLERAAAECRAHFAWARRQHRGQLEVVRQASRVELQETLLLDKCLMAEARLQDEKRARRRDTAIAVRHGEELGALRHQLERAQQQLEMANVLRVRAETAAAAATQQAKALEQSLQAAMQAHAAAVAAAKSASAAAGSRDSSMAARQSLRRGVGLVRAGGGGGGARTMIWRAPIEPRAAQQQLPPPRETAEEVPGSAQVTTSSGDAQRSPPGSARDGCGGDSAAAAAARPTPLLSVAAGQQTQQQQRARSTVAIAGSSGRRGAPLVPLSPGVGTTSGARLQLQHAEVQQAATHAAASPPAAAQQESTPPLPRTQSVTQPESYLANAAAAAPAATAPAAAAAAAASKRQRVAPSAAAAAAMPTRLEEGDESDEGPAEGGQHSKRKSTSPKRKSAAPVAAAATATAAAAAAAAVAAPAAAAAGAAPMACLSYMPDLVLQVVQQTLRHGAEDLKHGESFNSENRKRAGSSPKGEDARRRADNSPKGQHRRPHHLNRSASGTSERSLGGSDGSIMALDHAGGRVMQVMYKLWKQKHARLQAMLDEEREKHASMQKRLKSSETMVLALAGNTPVRPTSAGALSDSLNKSSRPQRGRQRQGPRSPGQQKNMSTSPPSNCQQDFNNMARTSDSLRDNGSSAQRGFHQGDSQVQQGYHEPREGATNFGRGGGGGGGGGGYARGRLYGRAVAGPEGEVTAGGHASLNAPRGTNSDFYSPFPDRPQSPAAASLDASASETSSIVATHARNAAAFQTWGPPAGIRSVTSLSWQALADKDGAPPDANFNRYLISSNFNISNFNNNFNNNLNNNFNSENDVRMALRAKDTLLAQLTRVAEAYRRDLARLSIANGDLQQQLRALRAAQRGQGTGGPTFITTLSGSLRGGDTQVGVAGLTMRPQHVTSTLTKPLSTLRRPQTTSRMGAGGGATRAGQKLAGRPHTSAEGGMYGSRRKGGGHNESDASEEFDALLRASVGAEHTGRRHAQRAAGQQQHGGKHMLPVKLNTLL
ncbi:hypothetical protein JKP88DRAFT_328325 [Tribonema minus]|uniref:Uncharacterized protein n=1 Tax=Tribonema minus TaxID=303371 RepID=A0A835YSS7_9STRA|nr:hypothetical protein JKP88DRAFT_328325 [Tribonema minus]